MCRLAVCISLALALCSCAVGQEPQHPPAGDTYSASTGCMNATKANLTSECFEPNPEAERRVGTRCGLHPSFLLEADTVAIVGGFISDARAAERPGRYIHSCLVVDQGCVHSKAFTEVAYCPECRRVRAMLEKGGR